MAEKIPTEAAPTDKNVTPIKKPPVDGSKLPPITGRMAITEFGDGHNRKRPRIVKK